MTPHTYKEMKQNLHLIKEKAEWAEKLCDLDDTDPRKLDRIFAAMSGVHDLWIAYDNEIIARLLLQTEERYGEDSSAFTGRRASVGGTVEAMIKLKQGYGDV